MSSIRSMWLQIVMALCVLIGLALLGRSIAQGAPEPTKVLPKVDPQPSAKEAAQPGREDAASESLFDLLLKGGWVMVPLASHTPHWVLYSQ